MCVVAVGILQLLFSLVDFLSSKLLILMINQQVAGKSVLFDLAVTMEQQEAVEGCVLKPASSLG